MNTTGLSCRNEASYRTKEISPNLKMMFCVWVLVDLFVNLLTHLLHPCCCALRGQQNTNALLLSACRSIRSACEVCGQGSSRSWCFCGTETRNGAAFRTRSKRWGTWWTRRATSRWATPCMCRSSVLLLWSEVSHRFKVWFVGSRSLLLIFTLLLLFSFLFLKRYVSPLTTSYAGTHRTLRSIGGGALSLDVIRTWLCSKWLRSVKKKSFLHILRKVYFRNSFVILPSFQFPPATQRTHFY